MRAIGNIIWFLFGGFVMGLAWWLAGILCYASIVGIPWGRACMVIGKLCFLPFGRLVVSREVITHQKDIGTGCLGVVGNVLWFVFCGLALAVGHLVSAGLCFITVIGIPFGVQHLKLAEIALAPIGKSVIRRPES